MAKCQGREWAARRSCVVVYSASAARDGRAGSSVMGVSVTAVRRSCPADNLSTTDGTTLIHLCTAIELPARARRLMLITASTSLPHTRHRAIGTCEPNRTWRTSLYIPHRSTAATSRLSRCHPPAGNPVAHPGLDALLRAHIISCPASVRRHSTAQASRRQDPFCRASCAVSS